MMNTDKLNVATLANLFDHTLLKAYATDADFQKFCKDAETIGVAMVAVNSAQVALCSDLLKHSSVRVGAAISFPLGQTAMEIKVAETRKAIEDGADEIDYVIHIGKAKMGHFDYIEEEMRQIVCLCKRHGVLSKAIFENCYLEKTDIRKLAEIARFVKPDFIKTSTGFGIRGATIEDVSLMKATVGKEVKVKAAGGIHDWETCKGMLEAGAERIGTSNPSLILNGFKKERKCE